MLLANLILISFEFSYVCSCKASSSETEPCADIKLCNLSKELCRVEIFFSFAMLLVMSEDQSDPA